MNGVHRIAGVTGLLVLLAAVLAALQVAPARAQGSIDPALLEEIQGRWVSRFDNNDTEIEIEGREIRYVRVKPITYNPNVAPPMRYNPGPGELAAIIASGTVEQQVRSLIEGMPDRKTYRMRSRCVSNHGSSWRMTDNPDCAGFLSANTYFVPGPGGIDRPAFEYRTLSLGGLLHGNGDFWRPEVKQRIFGPQKIEVEPSLPARTAPAARPAPDPAAPAAPPASPPDNLSIPVTPEQEQREVTERERLNREQAAFGTRQLAENEARRKAYEQALRDREATIARQQAEHEAAVAAVEAERLRREREYAEAMARWRADVEACKKGDRSRCAK